MSTRVIGTKGSTDTTVPNNKASGVSAHAEGSGTTASGDFSHAEGQLTTSSGESSHAEGRQSSASGYKAHAEGQATSSGQASHGEGSGTASADYAHAEGAATQATGNASHAEGQDSQATGRAAHALGVGSAATQYGAHAQAGGYFGVVGDAQTSTNVARNSTSNATPKELVFGGGTAVLTSQDTNVLTVPANRAHRFTVSVVARRHDVSGDTAGWEFRGLIARGSSGDAAFVGTTLGSSWGAAGAAAWDVTLTINTGDATNNYLAITVTGEAAKTIRWVARVDSTEVG